MRVELEDGLLVESLIIDAAAGDLQIGQRMVSATTTLETEAGESFLTPSQRFNKPDQLSDSYELRRYQLRRTANRPRTDLFELYWANKVPGTKLHHVFAWLRTIALRRPNHVSDRLRPIAYIAYAAAAAAVVAVISLLLALGVDGFSRVWHAGSALAKISWVSALLSLIGSTINWFLIGTLGDAARYLDAAPDNIAVRQAIRQGGVALLRRLHTEGRYDRITLVGHSLGSVICYDIIRLYWSEVYLSHGAPLTVDQTSLNSYEHQPLVTGENTNVDAFQQAQRKLWQEYRRLGHPWLITDLVTIGSPLTHAGTLLARSPAHLEARMTDRELPTCPPRGGAQAFARREQYLVDGQIRTLRMPTPAAPFALTRWTNIYAPTKAIVCGDPIGGPVAAIFGAGIEDVSVRLSSWWRRNTPWAHTSYWHEPRSASGANPTRRLWESLDIDSAGWLNQHVAEMPWEMSVGAGELDEEP